MLCGRSNFEQAGAQVSKGRVLDPGDVRIRWGEGDEVVSLMAECVDEEPTVGEEVPGALPKESLEQSPVKPSYRVRH